MFTGERYSQIKKAIFQQLSFIFFVFTVNCQIFSLSKKFVLIVLVLRAVTVDLADADLLRNASRLSRIRSCLSRLGKCSFVVSWKPPQEEICPSSVAKYFSDLGHVVELCTPNFTRHSVCSTVPEIDLSSVDVTDAANFVEWLGLVSVNGNFQEEDSGGYLSSYAVPAGIQKNIECLQWRGFFTVTDVKEIIEHFTKLGDFSKHPWISIYVQGFSDSPLSWANEEHHYFTNGDNGYIVIFDNEKGLFCIQKCSKKRYKNVYKYK